MKTSQSWKTGMNESSPKHGSILGVMTLHPLHSSPPSRSVRLGQKARRLWAILDLAVKKFWQIDGAQWARSFAFSAFFSLFPLLMLFLSLSLIYKLAPRRHKLFSQVWAAALCATVLLQTTESLFIVFLKNFAALHAVYGAFCAIVALLTWIFLFGCIFIFGACLCAAQAEGRSLQAKTITTH